MKKIFQIASLAIAMFLVVPNMSFANTVPTEKTFKGKVTSVSDNLVIFTVGSAAIYTAETANAQLLRRYGGSMLFSEITAGDKVEVKGILAGDNRIAASSVRNMSLYAHNGTFSGKVATINPSGGGFTLQSKQWGLQTIHTDSLTVFKKNGKGASLVDLELGTSISVKGVWDRTNAEVSAKEVLATLRLVNIYFTGQLVMRNNTALTVVGKNNAIYGIYISNAKLQNKTGKPAAVTQFNMGDTVRVWGKHVSERTQVTASLVKDSSLSN